MGDRILLVEDDDQLGSQIVGHLRGAGFEPVWWREGRLLVSGDLPDVSLVVLDLMLPGTYGLDMLKALRTFSEVPVLILSARNDTLDKVRALKLGADDYMTKPFWPEELVERVRARLRRPTLQKEQAVVEMGPLRIDLQGHAVQVQGRPVELTRVEFELLAALARRPQEAVTRQWLVEHVLDPEREGTERTLDVHVSRLRRKLGPVKCVETVWGVGYRLVPGEDA
ncbi:response regulator transcription factor [Corallococcus exiguus]|uniref:response regulator transcription factor n=1 Tax=Corallococcus exiguus TaxID=83462 RepID=UPI0015617FBF|nr:response regulator transcription factor [Corallococcus exiguus]NRD52344.1 response regulator transcription factor [Corallococcus exiguus]NRD65600.1 response regulator transcription factor [Corallococcus exiguus]